MKYIIYLIIIILITMFLTYLGITKDKTLNADLTEKLYVKCREKIIKYLKKNDCATTFDIQNLINGVSTSLFWSKKCVQIQEPVKFANYVIEQLYKEEKIKIEIKNNNKVYSLK